MAVIEIEFDQNFAQALSGLLTTLSWPVPVPRLETLPPDRLVANTRWSAISLSNSPSSSAPSGALGLTGSLGVFHASLQELRINPGTLGARNDYTAALSLAVLSNPPRVELRIDSLTPSSGARVDLMKPVPLFTQALPDLPLVSVRQGAFVRGDGVVTLRLATDPDDVLTGSLTPRRPGNEAAAIFIPATLFTDLVLGQLRETASGFSSDIVIARAPWAVWAAREGGATVSAGMTLVKKDACPAIFGDVDVTVDVSLTLDIAVRQDGGAPAFDLSMSVAADASDWDSFRCWVGSGAIVGGLLGLFWPQAGLAEAIASLVIIGNSVAGAVAEPLGHVTISGFEKSSSSDSSVSFKGGFALPDQREGVFAWRPVAFSTDGLTIPLTAFPPPPAVHDVVVTPASGSLGGDWSGRINCSHRSQDWHFALTPVTIVDTAKVAGFELAKLPVRIWDSSTAEPENQWYVSFPADSIAQVVTIKNRMFSSGTAGLAVVHSSAGLFAFTIPQPPNRDTSLDHAMQRVIDEFCDGQKMLDFDVNIVELKWVEPPPDYSFGMGALRQWQVGIEGLRAGERLRLTPLKGEHVDEHETVELVANEAGIASAQLVTGADRELRISRIEAGAPVTVRMRKRWIVPSEKMSEQNRALWQLDPRAAGPSTSRSDGPRVLQHEVIGTTNGQFLVGASGRVWLATAAPTKFIGG